jgi:hypothetical protein
MFGQGLSAATRQVLSCSTAPLSPHNGLRSTTSVNLLVLDATVLIQSQYMRFVSGPIAPNLQYLVHAVNASCPKIGWGSFCRDPLVLGDLCRRQPDCCYSFDAKFMYFHVVRASACVCEVGKEGELQLPPFTPRLATLQATYLVVPTPIDGP